jgi:intracellular sulfur oxidation DsrE/DsrF family protein
MKAILSLLLAAAALAATPGALSQWPAAQAPAVPHADGYVAIPHSAVPPDKARTYTAVFDATHAADAPAQVIPALNMVGSEVNALGVAGVPLANTKFAVVFHGAAIDGILTDENYKAKFGVSNPNLAVLAELKKAGVALFVCGQNLAFEHIEPKTLSPDVAIASDALIVLMTYGNDGYTILSF